MAVSRRRFEDAQRLEEGLGLLVVPVQLHEFGSAVLLDDDHIVFGQDFEVSPDLAVCAVRPSNQLHHVHISARCQGFEDFLSAGGCEYLSKQ